MVRTAAPDQPSVQLEEAADELARLDLTCQNAEPCAARTLWLIALAQLTDPSASTFSALVAADADPFHEAALAKPIAEWRTALAAEERRVRGGAFLSAARFPTGGSYPDRAKLEAVWRESSGSRPLLWRALDSAAWAPSDDVGEATAALLLCGGGRTDRVRCLPFGDAAGPERADATAEWRAGETSSWTSLGLSALSRRARRLRDSLRPLATAEELESPALEQMGRAAITARRALAALRATLAVTMPTLAEDLGLSRPAAADALERLVTAGLAREVTGRARDRVYAYELACVVADAALRS